jgi:hypothetical protein
MQQPHPHAGATYRVVVQKDDAFGVEVTIPDMSPTTVTGFAALADAERWIASHRKAVNGPRPERSSFRMPFRRG